MRILTIIPILMSILLTSCGNGEENEQYFMKKTLAQDLSTISTSRIFFAHMSVGENIITGISDIANEIDDVDLNIIERGSTASLPDSYLLHSAVGKNSEPVSKCLDFKHIIEQELKDSIDYALLKFCYIDIDENTDVEALFADYKIIMDDLISSYPAITFIHVTTALRHSASGVGIWLREFLGKPNRSKLANIKRNQFNSLLRQSYSDQPIFDLAASESTYPDGRREIFRYKGDEKYYGLIGEYTNDGGHLNEYGRRIIAQDFISELASIIRNRN